MEDLGKGIEVNEQLGLRTDVMVPPKDTGWKKPQSFPRLEDAKTICIDVETRDPNLQAKGPGCQRKDGYIVGVAVAVDSKNKWYFPVRHELGGNFEPQAVFSWLRYELGNKGQLKVGANILYDLEWLGTEDVYVEGPFYDVQWAEALIDEHKYIFSLESLSVKYLNERKHKDNLEEWCQLAFGKKKNKKFKYQSHIWQAPIEYVGPYAERDVDDPLRIMQQQMSILHDEELMDILKLEMSLIPVLLKMRQHGVRVDVDRAEKTCADLKKREKDLVKDLQQTVGFPIDPWSSDSLVKLCRAQGITHLETDKGNPSFPGEWLDDHIDPVMQKVARVRKVNRLKNTFIEGYILKSQVGGRVYAQFHPLKSEDGGTVTGRFSGSNPNLQNLPSRDPESKLICRGLFIPDEGHVEWIRKDYSQIEYRLMVHYGRGESARRARQLYNDDHEMDFHDMAASLTGLPRPLAKNVNFMIAYGGGPSKYMAMTKKTRAQADADLNEYHRSLPFLKDLAEEADRLAANRGYVKTIMGRRCRYNLWEPSNNWDTGFPGLSREEALIQYGDNICRSKTYKALNSIIQGSAAELLKAAMVKIHEEGAADLFNGSPLVTVHDELGFSSPGGPEADEALKRISECMRTAIPGIRVPVLSGTERGPSWGEAKEEDNDS